jgi:hypothetical protein
VASREPEIRAVAEKLDSLLDDLDGVLAQLNALRARAAQPPPDDETTERLVAP